MTVMPSFRTFEEKCALPDSGRSFSIEEKENDMSSPSIAVAELALHPAQPEFAQL
jgi:hypothetical protein